MDYTEIESLTRSHAKRIADVTDLIIEFSNKMKKTHAMCYWEVTPQEIHFNKAFIDVNKDCFTVINELCIHECIHLVPGCNRHNKKFIKLCEANGIEVYGYSCNYKNPPPMYRVWCPSCGVVKSFYSTPKVTKCKICNGSLEIKRV